MALPGPSRTSTKRHLSMTGGLKSNWLDERTTRTKNKILAKTVTKEIINHMEIKIIMTKEIMEKNPLNLIQTITIDMIIAIIEIIETLDTKNITSTTNINHITSINPCLKTVTTKTITRITRVIVADLTDKILITTANHHFKTGDSVKVLVGEIPDDKIPGGITHSELTYNRILLILDIEKATIDKIILFL